MSEPSTDDQSTTGTGRTCGVRYCAADPCVLHRDDEATTYIRDTNPISEPVCEDCDISLSPVALVGDRTLHDVRHKFECSNCGAVVVVVEARAEQRRLSAFAGDESETDAREKAES